MPKYIIDKTKKLNGAVTIGGSKNAALPILAAALLAESSSTICDVPDLADVSKMSELLCTVGASVRAETSSGITICCPKPFYDATPCESANSFRASFLIMGPLLARCHRAKISMPGGCRIGTRPVDLHLKGLASMGAQISQGHGFIEAKCKRLSGAAIYLDFPSVGATENLMMAATLADGQTVIENAAIEPEIVDLANFINSMGGRIVGAGTDTIRITGVNSLSGQLHTVIPDRIEAGTFAAAAAVTGGQVRLDNVVTEHMKPMTAKLRENGVKVIEEENSITVDASERVKAADIKTLPYPGFPTDMQAQYTSLMASADGNSMITETIFENRFMHVPELIRMGARIKTEGRIAVIEGVNKLSGAKVKATDLRAGAALVLAALAADGRTEIGEIEHIERGYFQLDKKLSGLGACITREES